MNTVHTVHIRTLRGCLGQGRHEHEHERERALTRNLFWPGLVWPGQCRDGWEFYSVVRLQQSLAKEALRQGLPLLFPPRGANHNAEEEELPACIRPEGPAPGASGDPRDPMRPL